MADSIHIEALELRAQIGVPEEERAAPQRLTLNLYLEPLSGFANTGDELANTVDYAAVCRAVQALASARQRRLLETLAEEIADAVLTNFAVNAVDVELRKYILSDTAFVAVHLRRAR